MKTLAALLLGLILGQVSFAHTMEDSCNKALKSPTPPALTPLELGLERVAALGSVGQGTAWREQRYDKRRDELVAAFSSGSFKKLVAAKPEVALTIDLWSQALGRVGDIDTAFAGLGDVEKVAFQPAYDAVRAALTGHALSWSKLSSRDLDFPRIQLILREISQFDTAKPKYSIYRLKRAIEMRYSLREYVECR